MTTTIFTWGYYGWGNHTRQLIEAVDAVEKARGFKPPLFVDIRIRRTVRAPGFKGSAFEQLLGKDRHRWMKSLGNRAIETKTGRRIQIAHPAAAGELLDRAIEEGRHKRRVIFFCSCEWPRCDGKIACHRTTVAGLLLRSAKRRGERLAVIEWPGGKAKRIDLTVTRKIFDAVLKGRTKVPLETPYDLAEIAGLPGGSIATLHSGGEKLHRVVLPAITQSGKLALPVSPLSEVPATRLSECRKEAEKLRREWGLNAAVSWT